MLPAERLCAVNARAVLKSEAMSAGIPVTNLPGTLPYQPLCYPPSPQTLANDIVNGMTSFVPFTSAPIWANTSPPGPDMQNALWFNLNNLKPYWFENGNWWRATDTVAGPNGLRMIWTLSEAALWSFDGGDGSDPRPTLPGGAPNPAFVNPTKYRGAVWMRDTAFDQAFALGIGTLPFTPTPLVVNPGDAGGLAQVLLSAAQMPPHRHFVANTDSAAGSALSAANQVAEGRADDNYVLEGTATDATIGRTSSVGGDPASIPAGQTVPTQAAPLQLVPPYVGVIFAMRTVRDRIP